MANHSTPFVDFFAQVQDLVDSQLKQNLNSLLPANLPESPRRIHDLVNSLYTTVDSIKRTHGSHGPDAAWNRFRIRPRHANSNVNHGLATPPRTPVNGQPAPDWSDLRAEIRELKSSLLARRTEVDTLNHELSEARRQLDDAKNTLLDNDRTAEDLRKHLADEYVQTERFDDAADQYDNLRILKLKERRELEQSNIDASPVLQVELNYQFQRGLMLLKAGRLDAGEESLRDVWQRRRDTYGGTHPDTREAQLQFCSILRRQNTRRRLRDAEQLYRIASFLPSTDPESSAIESDWTWALRNTLELAMMRIENSDYDSAIRKLKKVWSHRQRATLTLSKMAEEEILRLVSKLEGTGEPTRALLALAIVWDGNESPPPSLVRFLAKQGMDFHNSGQHARAILYLHKAWDNDFLLRTSQPDLGWALALSLCHPQPGMSSTELQSQMTQAEEILDHLSRVTGAQGAPTANEIKTLLAYAQLRLQKHVDATRNAQEIYNTHKNRAVLLNSPAVFHQTNTLIRALSQHNTASKYQEAYGIWRKLYQDLIDTTDNANIIIAATPARKEEQLKQFAETGQVLSKAWEKYRRDRQKGALKSRFTKQEVADVEKRIKRVKTQAEALKELAVRP